MVPTIGPIIYGEKVNKFILFFKEKIYKNFIKKMKVSDRIYLSMGTNNFWISNNVFVFYYPFS